MSGRIFVFGTILNLLVVGLSLVSAQQNMEDKKTLLCKTWVVKKVIIGGSKSKQKVLNDHISFRKDMTYLTYDSEDRNLISSVKGQWKLDESGTTIITETSPENLTWMKIIKLTDEVLVYEMKMRQLTWQVHMYVE